MTARFGKLRKRLCAALLCVCLLSGCLAGCGSAPDSPIANTDEIVSALRDGLRGHSKRITVRFSSATDVLDALPELAGEWVEAAMEETGSPVEGDYIRYQLGGYEIECGRETGGTGYLYTVSVSPKYYMYLYQEEEVTEALDGIMEGFGFDETTGDYEKLLTLYDYVCGNIRYDKWNRKNRYNLLRSTAYAGVIRGYATCQGYCVTLYRMLHTAGIDCRIVTGMGVEGDREEYHAWLIAALDGAYYALDPTWDAGREEYVYFLRGSADFPGHVPGEDFQSREFTARYPMSVTSYRP